MAPPPISTSRRILLVGAPNSGKLGFLQALTGSLPPETHTQLSHAGLSHTLSLKTKYYEVDVPIWIDEWIETATVPEEVKEQEQKQKQKQTLASLKDSEACSGVQIGPAMVSPMISTTTTIARSNSPSIEPHDPPGPTPWSKNYLTSTSRPVLDVLGSFILCFRKPPLGAAIFTTTSPNPPLAPIAAATQIVESLKAVSSIVRACGSSWDGVCLAIGMPGEGLVGNGLGSHSDSYHRQQNDEDALDEVCRRWGFEYVDFEARGRNDYGEPVGMERVKEALEANDWDNSDVDYCGYDEQDREGRDDTEYEGPQDAGVSRGVLGMVAGEFEEEMFGLRRVIEAGEAGSGLVEWGDQGLGLGSEREWGIGVTVDVGEGDEMQEKQVEDLERMMHRMAILKDLGQDDDKIKHERRKLAAELLREMMEEEEEKEGEAVKGAQSI